MGEAIIISILCVLSIFGVHKIFEMLLSLKWGSAAKKLTLVCRLDKNEQNAEMLVRTLAAESQNLSMGKVCVFIVCDSAEGEEYNICQKTAQQYENMYVGNISSLREYIET